MRILKTKVGIFTILMILTSMVLGLSYGTFVVTTEKYEASKILISNLMYSIDVSGYGKEITLPSGVNKVEVIIRSLNNIESKYSLEYKIKSGEGNVYYSSSTGWLPSGKIGEEGSEIYEKKIKIVVESESNITVEFNVRGGYEYNEYPSEEEGYRKVEEEYEDKVSYIEEYNLEDIIKEETNCISDCKYGGESKNNYLQYPTETEVSKNIWRIIGTSEEGIKIVSNQINRTTIPNISSSLNSFYNTLEKKEDYIVPTNKFNCSSTGCSESSYNNIGLITTYEYNKIGGVTSYLGSNETYFGLEDNRIVDITSEGIKETDINTESGIRPSVYLNKDINVIGKGTIENPYRITSVGREMKVQFNVNGSITLTEPQVSDPYIVDKVRCTNGSVGYWNEEGHTVTLTTEKLPTTCTVDFKPGYEVALVGSNISITAPANKTVGRIGSTSFQVTANSGYTLTGSSVTCTNNATATITNGTVNVSNIKSNKKLTKKT